MRPIRILLALSPLLIAAPAQQAVAQCKAATQLSGRWYGNDGGTYYLRRFGNEVWWVGISGDQGKSWTNAFHGTRNGDVITGEWVDVRGKTPGTGTLTLKLYRFDSMTRTGGTGSGFGATRWGRGGCPDTAGSPGGQ